MSLTTDRNHPGLGHGSDDMPAGQNAAYLVLSDEERAKGFVRPVRRTYIHRGEQPKYPLQDLTTKQLEHYAAFGYVKYERYPENAFAISGRYWTQAQLDYKGCGSTTTMNVTIAETYAREPGFYGATFCCTCSKHLPVGEFIWEDGSTVGS